MSEHGHFFNMAFQELNKPDLPIGLFGLGLAILAVADAQERAADAQERAADAQERIALAIEWKIYGLEQAPQRGDLEWLEHVKREQGLDDGRGMPRWTSDEEEE
jgi:hypothetical protein